MNILMINYEYPPLGGGGGVACKLIAEELVHRGHSVSVLTSKYKNQKTKEIINNVKIFRVPVIGRKSLSFASMISLFSWLTTSIPTGFFLCLTNKFDLINTHFFAPSGPTGLFLRFVFGIPNVIYAHGGDVFDPSKMHKTPSGKGLLSLFLRISVKIQALFAKKILCQTEDMKQKILNLVPRQEKKIEVVALPFQKVNLESRIPKINNQVFKLITLARLVPRKNIDKIINSLSNLSDTISLQIIGDGPELNNLKSLVKKLSLEKRVEFVGYIDSRDQETKYKYLAQADLFVLASSYEAFGVVLQEAMMAGLCILSSDVAGPRSILKEERNALFFDPNSQQDLINKINVLYSNKELRDKIGMNNKIDIQNYFPENIVPIFEEIFQTYTKRK